MRCLWTDQISQEIAERALQISHLGFRAVFRARDDDPSAKIDVPTDALQVHSPTGSYLRSAEECSVRVANIGAAHGEGPIRTLTYQCASSQQRCKQHEPGQNDGQFKSKDWPGIISCTLAVYVSPEILRKQTILTIMRLPPSEPEKTEYWNWKCGERN